MARLEAPNDAHKFIFQKKSNYAKILVDVECQRGLNDTEIYNSRVNVSKICLEFSLEAGCSSPNFVAVRIRA